MFGTATAPSHFKTVDEVYAYLDRIWEELLTDPETAPRMAATGSVLRIVNHDPAAVLVVDMPAGKVYKGETTEVRPNVEFSMSADDGNRFWLGKLNLIEALIFRHVHAKGSVPALLKLLPASKEAFPKYRRMLETDGRTDLLAG